MKVKECAAARESVSLEMSFKIKNFLSLHFLLFASVKDGNSQFPESASLSVPSSNVSLHIWTLTFMN